MSFLIAVRVIEMNNNLLNLYDIMLNESKQEWIQYLTSNRLLNLWTHDVPLIKLHGDVNLILTQLYQASNFSDIEVYAVIQLWDLIAAHQKDTLGNINIVPTYLQLFSWYF